MLIQYLQTARRLAGNDQMFARINDFDLRDWVNVARGQIAGEAKCIAVLGSLTVGPGIQQYPFSSITFPGGTAGVAGVLNVRLVKFAIGTGFRRVYVREWEFFDRFILCNPVPVPTFPREWAQYGQGAQGTLFINVPDTVYSLQVDTVCLPSPLTSDTDAEAVPALWTDAVPYYACYMAYQQLENKDKVDEFYERYQLFMARARNAATPDTLPHVWRQGPDLTIPNKLGLQQGRGQVAA